MRCCLTCTAEEPQFYRYWYRTRKVKIKGRPIILMFCSTVWISTELIDFEKQMIFSFYVIYQWYISRLSLSAWNFIIKWFPMFSNSSMIKIKHIKKHKIPKHQRYKKKVCFVKQFLNNAKRKWRRIRHQYIFYLVDVTSFYIKC